MQFQKWSSPISCNFRCCAIWLPIFGYRFAGVHFFQKSNLFWSTWYVIGKAKVPQKYCKGLTLSRQQQLKMFLKQLFMLHLFFVSYFHRKTAFSQPQFSVGKQYDLIKWIAFLRQAQIMLLNWQNFLNVFVTSTLSVIPEKYNPR